MTEAQIRYQRYLQSDHWRALRLEAFRVHGRKCFKCPATFGLDVHHLRYRHPWTLCTVLDVRPCCRQCHDKEHGINQVVTPEVKREAQRRSPQEKLQSLFHSVRSRRRLSVDRRRFVSNKLLHGTVAERQLANSIFQMNARLGPAPKSTAWFQQKENNSRQRMKFMKQRNKYAKAMRVRW